MLRSFFWKKKNKMFLVSDKKTCWTELVHCLMKICYNDLCFGFLEEWNKMWTHGISIHYYFVAVAPPILRSVSHCDRLFFNLSVKITIKYHVHGAGPWRVDRFAPRFGVWVDRWHVLSLYTAECLKSVLLKLLWGWKKKNGELNSLWFVSKKKEKHLWKLDDFLYCKSC